MKKLVLVALCAFSVSAALTVSANEADSTGGYCEAKSETCVVRGVTGPNELPAPDQIDWENDPAFKHGGLPPKNAK
jgi:hypothetical protein